MKPCNLNLDTLIDKEVKVKIKELSKGNVFDLNTYPNNIDKVYGCLYSYLGETGEYKKEQKEKK